MSKEIVAKRYALALFEIAKEQQLINDFEEQLRVVKEVFEKDENLGAVLNHPKLSAAKKKAIVTEAFSTLAPVLSNTLHLLIDRHRINIVAQLVEEYIELANEYRNTADATVYSVRPLTEDEQARLSAAFAAKVGKASLNITNVIQPSLIGGVKVRIGNRIFDGSISKKLETLQRQLLS